MKRITATFCTICAIFWWTVVFALATDTDASTVSPTADPCSSSPCQNEGVCSLSGDNFTCECANGFDGEICDIDINECSSEPCSNNSTCKDRIDGYICHCSAGWNGDNCTQNINECEDINLNDCSEFADCIDNNGSYTCYCTTGYQGDGILCTEIMLYPYYQEGQSLKGDDVFSEAIYFREGFPFFGKFYLKFYLSMNGYISFTEPYKQSIPQRPFPSPAGRVIIAPYWTDIDTSLGDGVLYYKSYIKSSSIVDVYSKTVLDLSSQHVQQYFNLSDFQSTFVFIATWYKVAPYPARIYADAETSTFQVVMATDGDSSYILFNYGLGEMQWKKDNVDQRKIEVGCSDGVDHFYVVDESFISEIHEIDKFLGYNTNKFGRWAFDVNVANQVNPQKACIQWHDSHPDTSSYIAASQPCPCTMNQALLDARFKFDDITYCASSLFSKQGSKQHCCYSSGKHTAMYGALIKGSPDSGVIEIDNLSESQKHGYILCCNKTSLCHLYYDKYPSDTCDRYKPMMTYQTFVIPCFANPPNE
uniref:Mucin-4-like n=1 Tax=Saccoglossus kowalevskii TaxID=10224 RepID=A0ABM0MWQ7_SACKO|nr:PREDICTED: mucin-4-like [Saccoglossus kowalevskii]